MAQFKTSLSNPCEVCGNKIILVNALAGDTRIGAGHYMCPTCKAVYYPTGKRNPSYPSVYDNQDQAFDTAHAMSLQGQDVFEPADSPKTRLALLGLKVGDVVQVLHFGNWEYANVSDADGDGVHALVPAHGHSVFYERRYWKSSMQPQPLPAAAPASQARLGDMLKRGAVKTAGKTLPQVLQELMNQQKLTLEQRPKAKKSEWFTVWTVAALQTGAAKVKTTLNINDVEHDVVWACRDIAVDCVVLRNPATGQWLAFEQDSGAMLAAGPSKQQALRKARLVFKGMRPQDINAAIKAAVQNRDEASDIAGTTFLQMHFE